MKKRFDVRGLAIGSVVENALKHVDDVLAGRTFRLFVCKVGVKDWNDFFMTLFECRQLEWNHMKC